MGGGGHFCGLRCFFTYSIGIFLGDFLHDVTLAEKSVVHGKVGGIVELLPNVSTNVTSAKWKYGDATVADADPSFLTSQFTGRSELDPKNFTLTIRDLTLGDSGDFQFIYDVNDEQQPTIFITLQVHDVTLAEKSVVHGKVGGIVELLPNVSTNVTSAKWKYGDATVADADGSFSTNHISSVVLIVGLIVGVLIIGLLIILLHCRKLKDLCCNRGAQPETVHQGETQLQVYSSLQYGDQNVYETLSGNEEAQQGCQ
ncbi:uncharacterized protein KZ484_003612 isoform 1-T1 [Pholidichthys leucotaenia]